MEAAHLLLNLSRLFGGRRQTGAVGRAVRAHSERLARHKKARRSPKRPQSLAPPHGRRGAHDRCSQARGSRFQGAVGGVGNTEVDGGEGGGEEGGCLERGGGQEGEGEERGGPKRHAQMQSTRRARPIPKSGRPVNFDVKSCHHVNFTIYRFPGGAICKMGGGDARGKVTEKTVRHSRARPARLPAAPLDRLPAQDPHHFLVSVHFFLAVTYLPRTQASLSLALSLTAARGMQKHVCHMLHLHSPVNVGVGKATSCAPVT